METRETSPVQFGPSESELPSKPSYHFQLDRRKFFKLFGGGLAVAFVFQDIFSLAGEPVAEEAGLPGNQVGAWIHIGEDSMITVYTGKVEVGQNIRTSLAQVVAEELRVPMSSINMIMGDTDLVPYDAGTFGSRSTPQMGTQLRKAAATARQALIDMAAKTWNKEPASLKAEEASVIDITGKKKLKYGELTKGQQLLLPIADQVETTPVAAWTTTGKTVKKVNGLSFITGRHKYVSDMKLPGMVYGKVLRAPSYQAKLVDADVSRAKAMDGVTVVQDGNFVAVAAPHPLIAEKAIKSINAKWEETEHPSRKEVFAYLVKHAGSGGGGRNANSSKGDVEQALASSEFTYKETYNIDYIAHVPLEPRAALAEWKDGKLTVWTGTQRPFGVQQELSDIFRIAKEKVRVIMPDTGSAYGGKHTGEAAIEAARIAQEVKKPVKLVWTREEEFKWAYFRPGGVIEVNSGLTSDGTINAWKFINYNSGPSGINTQYKMGSQQIAHQPSKTPLKQGSYRGLASTANVFAREAHIADMARLIKMDQFAFRIKNLDDDRLKAVLETAAKSFGWKNISNKPAGHGFGIACGYEKGGYVSACADVSVDATTKQVRIHRLVQAFECGAIINPEHLENQVLGCIVQGLGGALFEAVDFANGKILNAGFSSYRVPRFRDIPKIEIILLDRKDLASAGAGEAPIVCVAPAIRNAIMDATGVSLNTLPLIPDGRIPAGMKSA
jgi:isoquinoline 1-oxidoreductase